MVRNLTADELDARLEWLAGMASLNVKAALQHGSTALLIDTLDEIKHAAEQSAKHLRERESE